MPRFLAARPLLSPILAVLALAGLADTVSGVEPGPGEERLSLEAELSPVHPILDSTPS